MMIDAPFTPQVPLSPHDRVRRISALLCKAVMLAEAKRMVQPPSAGAEPMAPEKGDVTDIDERILNFLRGSGEASPLLIRSALGIPRSTAYWSFLRLRRAGQIVGNGRARALIYRLNEQEPPPEIIALN